MKKNFKIIVITILVFLALNLIGGSIVGWAGQTSPDILKSYGLFALYGLIFGVILAFVNYFLVKIGK